MELRQLRYFLAVAEEGKISRAAKKIFLTQPALSRQIKALEEEIGHCLLERQAHSIRLTPIGEALVHEARGLLEHADQVIERVRAAGRGVHLRVGYAPSLAAGLLSRMLISAIANGGGLYLPQVTEKVEDVYGNLLKEWPVSKIGKVDVSEKTLEIIQQALMGAVNDPRGTGWACVLKEAKAAGKTGTAQVIRMAQDFKKGDMERMPLKFRDHAWFVAYAPFEDPTIAVVVLVEHGGYGGAAAAPIAKRVIEKYLALEQVAPSKMANSSIEPD